MSIKNDMLDTVEELMVAVEWMKNDIEIMGGDQAVMEDAGALEQFAKLKTKRERSEELSALLLYYALPLTVLFNSARMVAQSVVPDGALIEAVESAIELAGEFGLRAPS